MPDEPVPALGVDEAAGQVGRYHLAIDGVAKISGIQPRCGLSLYSIILAACHVHHQLG